MEQCKITLSEYVSGKASRDFQDHTTVPPTIGRLTIAGGDAYVNRAGVESFPIRVDSGYELGDDQRDLRLVAAGLEQIGPLNVENDSRSSMNDQLIDPYGV